MSAEGKLREAIVAELKRQAANTGDLRVEAEGESHVRADGRVDLDDLVMVVLGSLAGGP